MINCSDWSATPSPSLGCVKAQGCRGCGNAHNPYCFRFIHLISGSDVSACGGCKRSSRDLCALPTRTERIDATCFAALQPPPPK